MKTSTIHYDVIAKLPKSMGFRIKLATYIIRLACFIGHIKVELEIKQRV